MVLVGGQETGTLVLPPATWLFHSQAPKHQVDAGTTAAGEPVQKVRSYKRGAAKRAMKEAAEWRRSFPLPSRVARAFVGTPPLSAGAAEPSAAAEPPARGVAAENATSESLRNGDAPGAAPSTSATAAATAAASELRGRSTATAGVHGLRGSSAWQRLRRGTADAHPTPAAAPLPGARPAADGGAARPPPGGAAALAVPIDAALPDAARGVLEAAACLGVRPEVLQASVARLKALLLPR